MEVIDAKIVLMIEDQWIVEANANPMIKKVSWCLHPDEGYILSVKTCLRFIFDVSAVDEWSVIFLIVVSGSNFAASILMLTLIC